MVISSIPSPRQARGRHIGAVLPWGPAGLEGTEIRYAGGAAALQAAAQEAGITLYVHAPYVLNVATTNNRIRIPAESSYSSIWTQRPKSARRE
jgi:hypothetical protein